MGYAKVKDEQFRVIEDVVRGRETFVSLPTGYGVLICYGYLNLRQQVQYRID